MKKILKQRLIKPYINFNEVKTHIKGILKNGILTRGKYVEEFRNHIKRYTRTKYCFLTTSGTTALWLSLKAINVKNGDEVIVSDFSFPATVNVVEDLGAIPVFADVDLQTFNMLPSELEKKITKRTKAVIFVDALGNPSGILKIKNICKRYNLVLIEDAACAFGSSVNGKKCGNIADITCFSFHPRKLITTGEGGAIVTNIAKYAKYFELKLNHGAISKNSKINFIDYGYNFRMTEIQAVLGIRQIEKIDYIIKERQKAVLKYMKILKKLEFVMQKKHNNVIHNVQSVVFKIPQHIRRDELIEYLKRKDIESTIGTYCLSNTTYYKKKYKDVQKNAAFLEENTITLPCFENVDVDYVCNSIKKYCNTLGL